MFNDRVIIDPDVTDCKELSKWLYQQGDMRGLLCRIGQPDEFLVIFDSYGNTHSSVSHALGMSHRHCREYPMCLIFRLDGGVYIEIAGELEVWEEIGSDKTRRIIERIYKEKGKKPYWTNKDEYDA